MKGVYETINRVIIDRIDDFWEVYEVDPVSNEFKGRFDEICEKPYDVIVAVKKLFREKMLKGEI